VFTPEKIDKMKQVHNENSQEVTKIWEFSQLAKSIYKKHS
jgi:hypothetical protein